MAKREPKVAPPAGDHHAQGEAVDRRPFMVLRMTVDVPMEEVMRQQAAANEYYAPSGVRVLVIPKCFEFAGRL